MAHTPLITNRKNIEKAHSTQLITPSSVDGGWAAPHCRQYLHASDGEVEKDGDRRGDL